MKKFREYNKYDVMCMNHYLTELATIKRNGRKKFGDKYSVYLILDNYLKEYGINVFGSTKILNLDGVESNIEMRAVTLSKDIPLENIAIIEQMYGFSDSLVNVTLHREETFEFAFLLNTETLTCELVEWSWGEIKNRKKFHTFAEMILTLRENDYKRTIFE